MIFKKTSYLYFASAPGADWWVW